MIRLSPAGALLAAGLCVAGCSGRFEKFPFLPADGSRVEIREQPGAPRGSEGALLPSAGAGHEASTPLYRLRDPVEAGGNTFSLTYETTLGDGVLTVYADERTALREAPLPPQRGMPVRFLLPLPEGSRVWGYRVSSRSGEGSLTLLGAGTERRLRGFAVRDGALSLDGSVSVRALSPVSLSARFSAAAREDMARGQWVVSLEVGPAGSPPDSGAPAARVRFTSQGGSGTRSFSVRLGDAPLAYSFTLGSVGFVPAGLEVEAPEGAPGGGPLARSCLITRLSGEEPVPSDPGLVLEYDRSLWRDTDFELFSWGLFPRVLIFDTADYAVQDGLFKRLAFFVEKAGYAGTIPDPKELVGRHGYNAHDYSAEDLARFFAAAGSRGIPLTSGEAELLRVLVREGIVRKDGTAVRAGEGAVLSISRSSPPALRRLLLTHEIFHGAFFSLPGFRKACSRVWDGLSDAEREVWKLFLSGSGYNVEDQNLVMNEFQAYLFQQERGKVGEFQAIAVERLRKRSPEAGPLLDRFLREHPDSFARSFDLLDSALRAASGPPGGLAAGVERLSG